MAEVTDLCEPGVLDAVVQDIIPMLVENISSICSSLEALWSGFRRSLRQARKFGRAARRIFGLAFDDSPQGTPPITTQYFSVQCPAYNVTTSIFCKKLNPTR